MLKNIKNRFNYALANNESGDIPVATIGFILLGILVVVLIWNNWNSIVETIQGWFNAIRGWVAPANPRPNVNAGTN